MSGKKKDSKPCKGPHRLTRRTVALAEPRDLELLEQEEELPQHEEKKEKKEKKLVPIKEKKSKFRECIEKLKKKCKCSLNCQKALRKTAKRFCGDTSINGVQYFDRGHGWVVRWLWYLFFLLVLLLLFLTLWHIYDRWLRLRTILIYFPNLYDVRKIPLPSFTICSEGRTVEAVRTSFSKFLEHCKKQGNNTINRPPGLTDDQFQNMRVLLQICNIPSNWQFEEFPKDNISFEYSINQMFPPFEDEYKHCHFNQTSGRCNYFFEKTYTDFGICYKFNALDDKEIYRDDTYQYQYCLIDERIKYRDQGLNWRIDKGFYDTKLAWSYPERVLGSEMGFFAAMEQKVKYIDPNCRSDIPGFRLIFHSPDDVPFMDKHLIAIRYNYGAFISVTPYYIYASDDIDSYEPKERDCYYPEERWLRFFRFYSQNKCELECLANYTLKRCNCVKFTMPRLSYTNVCDASKMNCYKKAKLDFYSLSTNENKCNCIPGCFHLEYELELNMGVWNSEQFTADEDRIYFNITNDTIVTKLYMTFKADHFKAWHRMQLVSTADFLSSLGSLLRLFIGASILSLFELFYYFTYRLSERIIGDK